MGDIIQALRLYVDRETRGGKYTEEDLKLLEKAGVFYGTTWTATRIKRLSKYAGRPDLVVKIDKDISSHVTIIEKTPHTAVVKVKDDSAVLELKDLFWLTELDLFPLDELALIKWVSNNFKLSLPERTKLYKTYVGVVLETSDGRKYYIDYDGSVVVEKTIEINGVKYTLHAPLDKEDTAISIARDLLEKILGNVKPRKGGTINWIAETPKTGRQDMLNVSTYLSINGRVFKAFISYHVPTGKASVAMSSVTDKYMYSVIHNILAPRYGIRVSYNMMNTTYPATVIDTGTTLLDLGTAAKIMRQAIYLLRKAKTIKTTDIKTMVEEIEKALEEKKVPIPRTLPILSLAELYFYGISRNNEKLTAFLRKVFRKEVEEYIRGSIVSPVPHLKNIVEKLGSPIAKKELEEMVARGTKNNEELVSA